MTFLSFLSAELRFRKKGVIANSIAVLVAAAAIAFLLTTASASKRSIQLITKNMGQNLILIHDSTKPEDYYMASGKEVLFPQKWIDTLFNLEQIVTTYHVAVLQMRDEVKGKNLIITGALPVKGVRESAPGDKKNPFIQIPAGTVRLGSEAALETGLKESDTVHIKGMAFTVTRIEEEKGTTDDYRVYLNLRELQSLTGKDSLINAIFSMECLCEGEPLTVTEARIRRLVVRALPDIKIMTLGTIAIARYEAREASERYNQVVISLLLFAAVAFIMVQSWTEARAREKESALLAAIGFKGNVTASLYLLKATLIALPSSLLGFFIGLHTALMAGPSFVKAKVLPDYSPLPWIILGAIALTILAFLPALNRTLKSDPFEILRED